MAIFLFFFEKIKQWRISFCQFARRTDNTNTANKSRIIPPNMFGWTVWTKSRNQLGAICIFHRIFRIMKKVLVLLLVVSLQVFSTTPQKDGEEHLSHFVGAWESSCFSVLIGERNDSLQFTMGGVFYGGNRIHCSEWNEEDKALQMMRKKTQR